MAHLVALVVILSSLVAGCRQAADAAAAALPAEVGPPVQISDAPTHGNGILSFKDPGVYVDGVPVGMLTFGELPVPLAPVWFEETASVAFRPGDPGPREKIVRQRRYRFADYLEAVGVDLERVRELHIYGNQRRAAAVIVSGAELRDRQDFTFRFGGDVEGKPLPACPDGVGDGKCPDSIGAVTVYLDRTPPVRRGGHFYLDGDRVADIPYHGPALRGGVRVYRDGRLATTIKRNLLRRATTPVSTRGGQERWALYGFLATQGVDLATVAEGWVIHRDRRVRRLSRDQLLGATFVASPGISGEILLGDGAIPTSALALHSRPVAAGDLPTIEPHEQHDAKRP
jgi:hypothetical protein